MAAGLTYALINIVTIPVDNTSVNPARSFGSAIFAGTDALGQLWLFIVFPLIGAAVGALIWIMLDEARLEDTIFAEVARCHRGPRRGRPARRPPGLTDAESAGDAVAGGCSSAARWWVSGTPTAAMRSV